MIDGKATLAALAAVRNLGQRLRLRGAILIAVDDDGRYGAISWGRTREDCRAMSRPCDDIADLIEQGRIQFFADACGQERGEK